MPGIGKAAQAVAATRRFEDSLHASMMPIAPSLCNEAAIGPENVEQAAQLIFSALWPLRTKCSSLRTVSASMVLVDMYQWMVNSGKKSRPSVPTTAPEISSRLWAWRLSHDLRFEEHKRTLDSDCCSRRRPPNGEGEHLHCETVNSPERSTYGVASSAAKMPQRLTSSCGRITSLSYVLTLEDPQRFCSSRDVGPYLVLVPEQEDSGDSQPQLGISKTGDRRLRRLLVGSSQYLWRAF
jgi:hypothetical protein